MRKYRCAHRQIVGGLGILTLWLCGCQDTRRHEATEDVGLPPAASAPAAGAAPKEVVQAFFRAISDAQASRSGGLGSPEKRTAYDDAVGRIRGVADEDGIYELVKSQAGRSMSIPHDITKNAALKLIIENWLSICAHYAGSFSLDQIPVSVPDAGSSMMTALVEAERPEDAQRLRAIEDLPEVKRELEKSGAVGTKGYQDYIQLIRAKALEQGFNYPIRARFRVILKKVGDAWRVEHLDLVPPQVPAARSTAPRAEAPRPPTAASFPTATAPVSAK